MSILDLYHHLTSIYNDFRSRKYIKKMSDDRGADLPVRVGFIVQMYEVWGKTEPLYRIMKSDERFSTTLVVMPPYDNVKGCVLTEYEDNPFLNGYDDAIKAYENGSWKDVSGMFDYLFYTRPYDHYLPEIYRTGNMVKYTRCCYIPYGYDYSDDFNEVEYSRQFVRNLYFLFVSNDYSLKYLKGLYSDDFHHYEFLGYPAFEHYFDASVSAVNRNLMWTPRWSYDEVIGGSHFFEYKDVILELSDELDVSVTFRPHPLLFGELINKGRMADEDVSTYLNTIDQHGIKYDKGSDLTQALLDTDILITDISSIIVEFFLTGKPIIYCDAGKLMNQSYHNIAEGFYIANNKDDLAAYIRMLVAGNDPLKEKRRAIINEHLIMHKGSSRRIADRILYDWNRTNK